MYKAAFEEVVEVYEEYKSVIGSSSCEDFYANMGQEAFNPVKDAGRVTVEPSDFVADVELSAKKVLTWAQYTDFLKGSYTDEIKLAVGKSFKVRKIHPLSTYLLPKDMQ
jgi:histone H3/H4